MKSKNKLFLFGVLLISSIVIALVVLIHSPIKTPSCNNTVSVKLVKKYLVDYITRKGIPQKSQNIALENIIVNNHNQSTDSYACSTHIVITDDDGSEYNDIKYNVYKTAEGAPYVKVHFAKS